MNATHCVTALIVGLAASGVTQEGLAQQPLSARGQLPQQTPRQSTLNGNVVAVYCVRSMKRGQVFAALVNRCC